MSRVVPDPFLALMTPELYDGLRSILLELSIVFAFLQEARSHDSTLHELDYSSYLKLRFAAKRLTPDFPLSSELSLQAVHLPTPPRYSPPVLSHSLPVSHPPRNSCHSYHTTAPRMIDTLGSSHAIQTFRVDSPSDRENTKELTDDLKTIDSSLPKKLMVPLSSTKKYGSKSSSSRLRKELYQRFEAPAKPRP